MTDHYRTLGVGSASSPDTIRRAYRDLARRLHPDHQRGGSPAERALAERRMREVNAAWAVLGDPDARRRYDASRAGPDRRPPPPNEPPAEDRLEPAEPEVGSVLTGLVRALPWVLALAVLGFIFVFTAYARGGGDGQPPGSSPGAGVKVGTCIAVHPGPTTTVVPCNGAGPDALRVVARVADQTGCPAGSEPRRLATDRLIDCVRPAA